VTRIGLTIAQSAKSSGGTKPWGTTGQLAWGRRDSGRSDRAPVRSFVSTAHYAASWPTSSSITGCPRPRRADFGGPALDGSRVELSDSLDAVVILAQPSFMIVDLLELTGMDYLEARELIPELSE
jgi:hypothetical protein